MVIMVWVVSRLELRAHPGTSSSYTYHHSYHWGNVAAPHGRPNLRSRLHYRHNQEGKPRSSKEQVVALEIKKKRQAKEQTGKKLTSSQ